MGRLGLRRGSLLRVERLCDLVTVAKPGLRAGDFLMNRAIRVLPEISGSGQVLPISTVVWRAASREETFRSVCWNSIFLVPVLDKFGINDPVHPFGWTLSFEMWFYVLFALLLLFIPGRRVPLTLIGASHGRWLFRFGPPGCLVSAFIHGARNSQWVAEPMRSPPPRGEHVLAVRRRDRAAGMGRGDLRVLGWDGRIRMEPDLSALRALVWGVHFPCSLGCVLEPRPRSGRLTDFGVALGKRLTQSIWFNLWCLRPCREFSPRLRPGDGR